MFSSHSHFLKEDKPQKKYRSMITIPAGTDPAKETEHNSVRERVAQARFTKQKTPSHGGLEPRRPHLKFIIGT